MPMLPLLLLQLSLFRLIDFAHSAAPRLNDYLLLDFTMLITSIPALFIAQGVGAGVMLWNNPWGHQLVF